MDKTALTPGRMMHRDQILIDLENKIGRLWLDGWAASGIAKQLGVAEVVVRRVIAANAPAVKP